MKKEDIPKVKRPSKDVLKRVQSLKEERGKIAAIEPKTGNWFLGKTLLDAVKKGRTKYPDSIFYVIRVGYPSAHIHRGGIKKI